MNARDGDAVGGGATYEKRPLGVVVASAVEGLRTLARQHVQLAKIEAAEAAGVRGAGVGAMAAAAVVAMYAVVWAAISIVAVILGLVAWVLVLVGRRTLKEAPAPGERTRENLKEDARWAKRQIAR